MDRQLKFRAWDSFNGVYYYSDDFKSLSEFFAKMEESERHENGISYEQWIWLTDKNGRDVYVGDLLKNVELKLNYTKLLYKIVYWEHQFGIEIFEIKLNFKSLMQDSKRKISFLEIDKMLIDFQVVDNVKEKECRESYESDPNLLRMWNEQRADHYKIFKTHATHLGPEFNRDHASQEENLKTTD